jgi:hypothetical protein
MISEYFRDDVGPANLTSFQDDPFFQQIVSSQDIEGNSHFPKI